VYAQYIVKNTIEDQLRKMPKSRRKRMKETCLCTVRAVVFDEELSEERCQERVFTSKISFVQQTIVDISVFFSSLPHQQWVRK
jgi:hypothetical protein